MAIDKNILIEQYKLYVGTAEKVSEKRQTANTYFLSLNSFLLIFSGYLTTTNFEIWNILINIVGIFICICWVLNLQSYKNLNSAKYKIIQKMEEKFLMKLFSDEWNLLESGENKRTYFKLSVLEQGIPFVFIILYYLLLNLRIIF